MEPEQPKLEDTKKRRRVRKVWLKQYVKCLKVVLPGKTEEDEPKFVLVPVDKASSDNQRSLIVANVRDVVQEQLRKMKRTTMTPAEIKDLVKAVGDLDALMREQWLAEVNRSGFGKELGSIIRNAAAGGAAGAAMAGSSDAFMDKIRKMDEAKKKEVTEKTVVAV